MSHRYITERPRHSGNCSQYESVIDVISETQGIVSVTGLEHTTPSYYNDVVEELLREDTYLVLTKMNIPGWDNKSLQDTCRPRNTCYKIYVYPGEYLL